jgi:hypothetical protein
MATPESYNHNFTIISKNIFNTIQEAGFFITQRPTRVLTCNNNNNNKNKNKNKNKINNKYCEGVF